MELRVITVGELKSFVEESAFSTLLNVPITPFRAISQQQNPNAKSDDPGLVIAYDSNKEVLAYFGCLPDRLNTEVLGKVCWSSCWWVHPAKGKSASMPVFYKALQLWEGEMLFDALPERSRTILERMGYFSFRKMEGIQGFLRFKFHKIIPSRIPVLAPLKNVFYVLDNLFNLLVQARLAFRKRKNKLPADIRIQRISEMDDSTEMFIKPLAGNELINRNKDTFNWIFKFPWLSSNKKYTKTYYFSSQANSFENVVLKVYQKEELIGFLWITNRDGVAKLPYCYVLPGKEDIIVSVLIHQLIEQPVETFIFFQSNILTAFKQSRPPFLFQKQLTKVFGWSKTLDKYLKEETYIQDGDGDGVFT